MDLLLRRCSPMVDGKHIVVEVNRYGHGEVGNTVVSIESRADIDAVIRAESSASKKRGRKKT